MKKPLSKILDISQVKIKPFPVSESQANETEFELGDVVTFTIKARVNRTGVTGENLFAFTQEIELIDPIPEMTGIKKYAEIVKEKEAKEKAERDARIADMEKTSGAKSKSQQKRERSLANAH